MSVTPTLIYPSNIAAIFFKNRGACKFESKYNILAFFEKENKLLVYKNYSMSMLSSIYVIKSGI